MIVWDYQLSKDWKPKTDAEWQWFLVRKLQYRDFYELPKEKIRKYLPRIKDKLEPAVTAMLETYFAEQKTKHE